MDRAFFLRMFPLFGKTDCFEGAEKVEGKCEKTFHRNKSFIELFFYSRVWRILIEFRKTESKGQSEERIYLLAPIKTESKTKPNCRKRGKTRVTDQVVIGFSFA